MRVAFLNRQREAHPGGDLVLIDALVAALRPVHGIEAVYAPEGWTTDWLRTFDLVHIFHCNFGWSRYNFERAQQSGMPYVVSPIFYPDSSLGMSRSEIWTALSEAKAVMPNSKRESAEMDVWLGGWAPLNTVIVPNGSDEMFHSDRLMAERLPGVLHVSARQNDKNEALVRQACAEADVEFHHGIGVGRVELAGWYKSYRVFVNASPSDRMSLTIGEALCAGCRVIATSENRGNEWYGPGLVTFTPHKGVHLLADMIHRAMDPKEPWDYSPNRAARRLTWRRVAGMLAQVYYDVVR